MVAASKKPTTKKTSTKKLVATKAQPKKRASKRGPVASTASYHSFKLAPGPKPFVSFRITKQTVYWVIIVSVIIFSQLLIIRSQLEIANLIEQQQINGQ